jgi:ABC-type sugar transport system ATPase subunit
MFSARFALLASEYALKECPRQKPRRRYQAALKVSAKGITKKYGEFYANKSVDLDIRTGEFLTLLGPSGCGKSTLMRVIAGLETCDGGTIEIDGRDVTREPPRRRGLGMVF